MKLLVFIMSLLVPGLSCLPCADESIGEHKVAKHHEEESEHDDGCSPFCHCTCCAGFSVNHYTASVSDQAQPAIKIYTDYLLVNIIEVSLPVWQPPKVV